MPGGKRRRSSKKASKKGSKKGGEVPANMPGGKRRRSSKKASKKGSKKGGLNDKLVQFRKLVVLATKKLGKGGREAMVMAGAALKKAKAKMPNASYEEQIKAAEGMI
jgi:hypothetical protein